MTLFRCDLPANHPYMRGGQIELRIQFRDRAGEKRGGVRGTEWTVAAGGIVSTSNDYAEAVLRAMKDDDGALVFSEVQSGTPSRDLDSEVFDPVPPRPTRGGRPRS